MMKFNQKWKVNWNRNTTINLESLSDNLPNSTKNIWSFIKSKR